MGFKAQTPQIPAPFTYLPQNTTFTNSPCTPEKISIDVRGNLF
jgi:hypothetical protein